MPVFAEAFRLSLCISCPLSRLFPRRSSGISCFTLCVKCLVVCCAPAGTTLFLHTVIVDELFCLAQIFICFASSLPVANGWGLSCLTNVGVEAEEPKVQGQRCGGDFHYTHHRRTTFSLAYLLQFYRSKSSASGTPLVCCAPVGVCLQQRSAHQKDRVSAFAFAISNLIPLKDQVLNMINEYLMRQAADNLHNALVQSVDPNVADAELERRVDRTR